MKIDTTKPLKTRAGTPVAILTGSARSESYPIVGYIGDCTGLETWTAEGKIHCGNNTPNARDLVYDVPAVEAWFNCYADGRMIRYDSKETAYASAKPGRVACIKVSYQEGQYD
jgi:hypothetical protein